MKQNSSKLRLRKGLTLVELAVVVLILGAIITLVAINIKPDTIKTQTAGLKLRKDSNELMMYLEQYAERYGTYPTEEQGILSLVEKPTVGNVPENYRPIVKNKKAVLDPWNTPYKLRQDDGGNVQIITLGKDKREGGEGLNKDFDILKEDEYPDELLGK
jgi:general secretion pathway protein G